jgi:hypothetical protein
MYLLAALAERGKPVSDARTCESSVLLSAHGYAERRICMHRSPGRQLLAPGLIVPVTAESKILARPAE